MLSNQYLRDLQASAFKFYGTSRFIDDLSTIKWCFSSSYKYIYPKQLELKLEHQDKHETFLDLLITTEDSSFVYKLFDKKDNFHFFIVHMPYLSSNIPPSIFYGPIC